ncbi:Putative sensor/response regulator hybrid [Photobacterium marinum]|uniref:histidine kinase n=1 Tax=Photobacterium marinum TaxID=1056511 RepID=L8JBE8_9GAMM|nr:ATP-binding protein [Photobacterium marinum]ELR65588.1 Putative sensor/response regulator hybrid [Photobacterium marinum]
MMELERRIELLGKKLEREKAARKDAEKLLEVKSYELFNAKKLLENSLEKLKQKSETDSELLAYQAKIETMLVEYGRLFLKHPPSKPLIQELVDSLIDSISVTACCIDISCTPDVGINTSYTSGRRQKWARPEQLATTKTFWDQTEGILWISLDSEKTISGFFAVRIKATRSWQQTIKKHITIFCEMIRASIRRQLTLEEAIEARRRAEASELATRDFLAMINHELRTPLNGVLGSAELLEDTRLTQQQHKLLNTLNHSGELLRAIINDLLDYSKINAGMLELIEKPFNCHNMAKMLEDIFHLRASEKRLDLKISCSNKVPRWLIGDEDRIKQIFVNLIGNAIKFTAKGHISVHLDWQEERLVFSVQDSGCGIAKEEQNKLFKPFSQVDLSSKRSHEGTGLGLAICKQLSEQMKGEIQLDSDYGKGTTFTVSLPLPIHNQNVDDYVKTSQSSQSLNNLNVLVVEDLKTNQMLIKLMLSKLDILPTIADNGQQALDILSSESFDVILMDCRMPVMDGYCATRKLRKGGYAKPILALTAGTTSAEREECLAAGMDDILCKPYQSQELREMLEKWGAKYSPS